MMLIYCSMAIRKKPPNWITLNNLHWEDATKKKMRLSRE